MTIYLLRHGQTEFNLEGRLQGAEVDSPLTPLGRQQAAQCGAILRRALSGTAEPTFVSSPAARARHTMEIVLSALERPISYDVEPRLREIGMGRAAGLTLVEVQRTYPDDFAKLQTTRRPNDAPEGGETDHQLDERVASWLSSVTGDVVVVSHRTTGRFLRAQYLNLAPDARASLDEPHDSVFRLEGGDITQLI